jgi:hypothetical protein
MVPDTVICILGYSCIFASIGLLIKKCNIRKEIENERKYILITEDQYNIMNELIKNKRNKINRNNEDNNLEINGNIKPPEYNEIDSAEKNS